MGLAATACSDRPTGVEAGTFILAGSAAARGTHPHCRRPLTDEALDRLLASGFVRNTLFRIAGTPRGGVRVAPHLDNLSRGTGSGVEGTVAGRYDPRNDEILLNPELDPETLEQALIHEEGHRLLDSLMSRPADSLTPEERLAVFGSMPAFQRLQAMRRKEAAQRHAASHPMEHWPEAFRFALDAMRTPAGPTRDSAVARAEREMPGAVDLARFLATLPAFRAGSAGATR